MRHRTELIMKDKLKKIIFEYLINVKKSQKEIAYRKLYQHSRYSKYVNRRRGMILHLVFRKTELMMMADGLNRLQGQKKHIHKLSKVLSRAETKYIFNYLDFYFKRLRTINTVENKKVFRKKLQNLCRALHKNHKYNLRQRFEWWHSLNYIKKTHNLDRRIAQIFTNNARQGFDEIEMKWKRSKYDQLLNGLMAVMNVYDKYQFQRCRWAMETIKKQFTDSNPWFRKTITIWTEKVKPNYQISFWRLRYEKPSYAKLLSAEQVVHIKKLNRVLQIIKNRTIFKVFMAIDNYSHDIAESQLKR